MQNVTSTFSGYVNAPTRPVSQGLLISWDKTTASNVSYFTIGSSKIGGGDIIKSSGGTPAFIDQYNYKDYSKYAAGWTISKKLGQYPYGLMLSQADITLNNASNLFTATSGTNITAIGPYVKTGRPVKISVGFNNETINQFVGYTDTPVFDTNSRTVQLHCYDAIDYLNSYVSASPTQTNKTADAIIQTLLLEAGFSTNQFVLEPSKQKAIGVLAPQGQTIGDIIQQLCEAEGALFFCDENGIMHFWNRQHFVNNTTPVATFTYSNTTDFTSQDTPIINYVSVTSQPLSASGTKAQIWSLPTPQFIGATGPTAINAILNPSFEVSASGWGGVFTRVNGDHYAGSYSLSGTNMIYDVSAITSPSSDGIGQSIAMQAYVRAAAGRSVKVSLNGTAVNGSTINGTPSVTVNGNNAWQNVVVNGSHYATSNTGGLGAWQSTQSLPYAIADTGVVSVSGYLYVIGGSDSNQYYSNSLYSPLTPGTTSFSYTSSLPKAMNVAGITTYSGIIYTAGGYNGSSTAQVYYSRVNGNGTLSTWAATTALSGTRSYNATTATNSYIFNAGGWSDSAQDDVTTVQSARINADGTIGQWQTLTSLPSKRESLAMVTNNGFVYVIGGFDFNANVGKSDVYYAAINGNGTIGSWTAATSLPVTLDGHQAIISGGYLYVLGGYKSGATPSNTVYYVKINANGSLATPWNSTSSFTNGREFHGAAQYNGNVYVAAGYNSTAASLYSDVQYAPFLSSGVTFSASGTQNFLLDAISNNTALNYFDGDSLGNSSTRYSWLGAAGLSASQLYSIPAQTTVTATFSQPVTSIDTPLPGTVSGTSSYLFNTSADGTGTDITSLVTPSAVTVSGYSASVTFQNNSSVQGYLTSLSLWGVEAITGQSVTSTQFNKASSLEYKLNPANGGQILTIDNNYIQDSSSAAALAFNLVNGYGQPYRRLVAQTFVSPQLQFGDLVQFLNRETGETRKLYVVGVTTSLSPGGDFKQELVLEERAQIRYFTIGTSTIGSTDEIAP